jgi:hypothetical protein
MRHRKAIMVARSYVEYMQGRIHSDFKITNQMDARWAGGNLGSGYSAILDERDPMTELDDIRCRVAHGQIVPVDNPQTGVGWDYYKINVIVEWDEPDDKTWNPVHSVVFHAYMVPKDL